MKFCLVVQSRNKMDPAGINDGNSVRCSALDLLPFAIYRGSESRPHAIRRALLQQGAHHKSVESVRVAGCRTLEAAIEWLEERRRIS